MNALKCLEQIMKSIGYEHRNGLITAFRKKYGCPPATYRKEKIFQTTR